MPSISNFPTHTEVDRLIFTRRPNETLYVGDDVRITVLGVIGNQVRLGIQAPLSVAVDREEIHDRKRSERLGVERAHIDLTPP